MRLFAALIPPPDALDDIEAAVAPYRTAWPHLRWVREDLRHVTLAFFGEVDETALTRLTPRLERAAARHPPLDLSLAGAGAFPSGGRARVLWAGLYGDRRELAGLAASASAAGRRSGVGAADRRQRFHPHLTLARCRVPTDLRPLVEALSAYAGCSWTADALHLMRSHLGPQIRYEAVESWPLRKRSGE
ncbi:MAG: RNA 2',3'-cyclic phosphodiesterase [Streptosporangiales bacterium]|nr:RNA 2',3'-cyclic phosphodiesterase [Streptosporangiales bacterium]